MRPSDHRPSQRSSRDPLFPNSPDAPLYDGLRALLAKRPRRRVRIEGFRPAAVLIPLLLHPDDPRVVFVQRVQDGSIHSGQVAFPGGGRDPEDTSIEETALREAEEEANLPRAQARVLGCMDDNATISQYVVTPVIALVTEPVDLAPQPEEVEAVFNVPLAHLIDPVNERRAQDVEFMGQQFALYEYEYGGHRIWGVTGRMLHEFLEVLRPMVGVERTETDGDGALPRT